MARCFQFINFDKHQVSDERLFRNNIVENLTVLPPLSTLEAVFRRIFKYEPPSYVNRNDLGDFAKIPMEILPHIFEALDLIEALMLGLMDGQLFMIGYRSILNKIEALESATDWAYNRILYLVNRKTHLTRHEERELFAWALARKDGESEDEEKKIAEVCRASTDGMSDEDLARHEDQTLCLFKYAKKTMSRCNERDAEEPRNKVLLELLEMAANKYHGMGIRESPRCSRTLCSWERYYQADLLGIAKGRGAWAGDRLAIVLLSMMEEKLPADKDWKKRSI